MKSKQIYHSQTSASDVLRMTNRFAPCRAKNTFATKQPPPLEDNMPTNGTIAAFWLQYEYVRLDIIGTISALQDFLSFAREEELDVPVEYKLAFEGQESRVLQLTPEAQDLWGQLKETQLEVLRPAENPLESSMYLEDLYDRLNTQFQAGELDGFALFTAYSPAPVNFSARTRVSWGAGPTVHTYSDLNVSELDIKCLVVGGPQGIAVSGLIGLEVRNNGSAPFVSPRENNCGGFRCYTYRNRATRRCNWETRVWPTLPGETIRYHLQGSRDPMSMNIHTFMR